MALPLDEKSLKLAFEGRPDLQTAIHHAAVGAYIELFNEISRHILSLPGSSGDEPASKKRRLEENLASRPASASGTNDGIKKETQQNGSTRNATTATPASGNDPVLLEVKDISVVIPQRKKYTLCFTASHLYARLGESKEPVAGISYALKDIEYAFCLPVPEKSQKQFNYVLFPKNSIITPAKPVAGAPPAPEPIVFTIPDSAPKPGTIGGQDSTAASAVSDDFKTLFDWAFSKYLKSSGSQVKKITEADANLFASTIKQPHRPKEKAVHVKGFRGSKDGYLFFLPDGILWGFKKPMLFLPHSRISAVSYTSVLQRTFNLNIDVDTSNDKGGEETQEEFEFAMLDQEDFAGINEFVQRHGLQDKSMAEQRKAKRANVNVLKDENGVVVGTAESGELEKAAMEAEQAAMDEEDEDEEDYDPGSEGESEGSGSSSEEDDDDENGGDGDGDGEEEEEDDDGGGEVGEGDGEDDEL
ncbi:hypothetical protein PVAG01_01224 [Phlyctema vagabunda]|uniref:Histone chaperone RTT106/FACT complex subunit SPT16-like middle domain-containing protein n=1 Tax=Phlyctema vagabunda TaxID=108571 RepID=A0ABR4PWW5_9HELO